MNILPLFIVKWLARRYGERVTMGSTVYASATSGVWIRIYKGPINSDMLNDERK